MSLTVDRFLGGILQIKQPAQGFRAGVDAVLLAAACPALPGDRVLDLGCGVGTAGLCLARRVPVQVTGLELQPRYAQIARDNAEQNNLPMEVVCADLRKLPPEIKSARFDHVIANPPYFQRANGKPSQKSDRELALAGETPIADWISTASKRLRPKGWLTLIQQITRMPEVFAHIPSAMGTVSVTPIAARNGRAPHLFILRARKEGRGAFVLHPAFIMHKGASHLRDGDDFTHAARSILRNGAEFPWMD